MEPAAAAGAGAAAATRKDMDKILLRIVVLLPHIFPVKLAGVQAQPQGREACVGVNNQSYFCETGHCCGESQCCNYYYELWWFWLVWTIIIILSCCCICHHRRAKLRLQQQQRQREINLIAYQGARNYSLLPLYLRFLPSYLLPPYEEVVNRPVTPPPPYSAFHQQPVPQCNGPSISEPPRAPAAPGNAVLTVCEAVPRQDSSLGPDSPRGSFKAPCGGGGAEELVLGSEREPVRACRPDLEQEDEGEEDEEEEEEFDCPEKEQLNDYYPGSSSKIETWQQQHQPSPEIKDTDKTPGRHRRFTGDSGIEVCVCNRDGDDAREVDGLMDGTGGAVEYCSTCDVCDACPRPDTGEEGEGEEEGDGTAEERKEQHGTGLDQPVCLLLDTINENELLQAHQRHDPQT